MEKKIVVPYAPILVESTRSIGYSFEAAVADIIDNSISASATKIRICFSSQNPQWLYIEDDGWGMTADELEIAMRYGSQSSHDVRRKDDLGRFGLGLKMASLSQCRRVTVLTKKDGVFSAARWDLDYIIQQQDWALQVFTEEEMKDAPGALSLRLKDSGTVVIWEQFDRLQQGAAQVQKAFDEKIDLTRKHISLVFHRFINDDTPKNRITIEFNGEAVKATDPFLTRHPATQPMSEQVLRIGSEEIKVKPYVLPYISKMSKQDIEAIGGKEDLRQQSVLEKLEHWLRFYNVNPMTKTIDLPMLLIDDEADNASVNTKQDTVTAINKGIRKLLALFEKSNYVGFTATPYANVFIDPDTEEEMLKGDLFPRDFIYALEAPHNYIGARLMFGEKAPYSYMLEPNDDCEQALPIKHTKYDELEYIPDSLKEALAAFFIANAVRDLRGDTKSHRTMMINISRFIDVQNQITRVVDRYFRDIKREMQGLTPSNFL